MRNKVQGIIFRVMASIFCQKKLSDRDPWLENYGNTIRTFRLDVELQKRLDMAIEKRKFQLEGDVPKQGLIMKDEDLLA